MAEEKKRRKRRRTASKGLSVDSVKNYGVKGLCIVAGLAAGSVVQKFVSKKDSVSGTDLLGLDGTASKVVAPLATIGVGLATSLLVKEPHLKMVGIGISAAGGVSLANNFLGENKIALGGDDNIPLPGVGNLGEITNFDQLPTNYDLEKTFHETPDGVNSDVDTVEGTDDDIDFENPVDGVDLP